MHFLYVKMNQSVYADFLQTCDTKPDNSWVKLKLRISSKSKVRAIH